VQAEEVKPETEEHDSTTGKVYTANNKAIQKLNELAAKIQRKGAPEINVKSGNIPIKQEIAEKRLKDRDGRRGEAGKWHYCPAPEKEMTEYAHNGYSVEIDETGEPIRFGTDIMYRCPASHAKARIDQTVAIHNKRVGSEKNRSNTQSGVTIENESEIPEDKLSVEDIK